MNGRNTRLVLCVLATALLALSVVTAALSSGKKTTSITVAGLIPGSTPEAQAQLKAQVALFQKANPSIKVKTVDYQWLGSTFAAKLAAGTLPMVLTVPFTDARTLGDNGQLADLTPLVKKWPYFKKFNPAVLQEGTTAKGKIVGIPTAAYAQALHYNRKLFTQAGLDPNKPPTSWAQIRQYAKQIAQKTGAAGYAEMGQNDNTAGWILTTVTYALGGRMETGSGTSAKATLNNPYTAQALNMLKQMRWTDNSMGSTTTAGARSTRPSQPGRSACSSTGRTSTRSACRTRISIRARTESRPSRSPTTAPPVSSAAARSRRFARTSRVTSWPLP